MLNITVTYGRSGHAWLNIGKLSTRDLTKELFGEASIMPIEKPVGWAAGATKSN